MSEITYPRAAMLDVRMAYIVITSVLIVALVFILICHVISLYSLRPGEIHKKHNRWRVYLFLATLFDLGAHCLLGASFWIDWRVAPGSCLLLESFLTMLFVNMRQFSGLVLYSRATVVHDGLRLRNSNLLIFREFLWYSITFGVWIIFGWSFWVNYLGKVVPEGMCVLYSRFPAVILTFAVLDALMSLGMLLLFIVPLTAHTREMVGMAAANTISEKLRKIIQYNFGLSLCLTLFDTLGLVGMTIILLIVDGEVVDPLMEHIQMLSLLPPTITTMISIFGLHTMTLSWIPRNVRVWFDRSEFSVNDLNHSSANQQVSPSEAGVVFLGNIHGNGKTIETRIQVRHYVVPFDTLNSKIFGLRMAKWIAKSYSVYKWTWRLFFFAVMMTESVLGFLILMGILPSWLSWVCLVGLMMECATDNHMSLTTMKLMIMTFGVGVRVCLSFTLMFLLFDIVGWDQRCAIIATMFLGMQYTYFTDALVRESREAFLFLIYFLSPAIPFWVLVLLQGDLIAGRHNTIIVFETLQRYEYSVYLAARDVAFLLCLLSFKDLINVGRGKGRYWFLFLDGDVAVRVVGLSEKAKSKTSMFPVPGSGSGGGAHEAVGSLEMSNSGDRSPKAFLDRFSGLLPRLSSFENMKRKIANASGGGNESNESSNPQNNDTAAQRIKVMMNMIELRESDSLVVQIFGIQTGSKLLQIYTEPWFRLINEWLLGFPLAFYVCAILPGFVDARLSYLLLLSILPFLRNFGLKSAKLLKLLMFRLDFFMELSAVITMLVFFHVTYLEKEKAIIAYYLGVFWLDIRTNDARCVFFHTGTRRGRRLSPFERLLFRAASVQIAGGFIALPILLVIGLTSHADYYSGFKIGNSGTAYPDNLDQVFFYESGANATLLVVWKLILDVYMDLFQRGKGVRLRYLRAPIAPVFSEGSSAGVVMSDRAAPAVSMDQGTANPLSADVFAATYHGSSGAEQMVMYEITEEGQLTKTSDVREQSKPTVS